MSIVSVIPDSARFAKPLLSTSVEWMGTSSGRVVPIGLSGFFAESRFTVGSRTPWIGDSASIAYSGDVALYSICSGICTTSFVLRFTGDDLPRVSLNTVFLQILKHFRVRLGKTHARTTVTTIVTREVCHCNGVFPAPWEVRATGVLDVHCYRLIPAGLQYSTVQTYVEVRQALGRHQ